MCTAGLGGNGAEKTRDELGWTPEARCRACHDIELERNEHLALEGLEIEAAGVDQVDQLARNERSCLMSWVVVRAVQRSRPKLRLRAVGENVHPCPHGHRVLPSLTTLDVAASEERNAFLGERFAKGISASPPIAFTVRRVADHRPSSLVARHTSIVISHDTVG